MKTRIAALTEVDEALRGHYEAKDGAFVLKIEGEIPELVETRNKLAEFRDNNIKFLKERDEAALRLKAYEGIDPTEHRLLAQKLADLEKKGGVKEPADIETKIRAAVQAAIEPLQTQIKLEKETRTQAEQRLAQRDLETKLREVGTKLKVLDAAVPDFLSRGLRTFRVDGKAYEVKDGAESLIYSREKVTEPLTMEEWGRIQLSEAPHLFAASQGGGARPGSAGAGMRTISGADPVELGRHIKEIAKGKILVVPQQ